MDSKILELFERKKKELGLRIVRYGLDKKRDLHVLCQRESDRSYVVWTSFFTGEKESSYVDFYGGRYDLSADEGEKILSQLLGRR